MLPVFTLCACTGNEESRMTVDILDIGKADCIVLCTGTSVCMIDTGEEEDLDDIRSYLSGHGIQKIDYLIISHLDKDHVGGASGIVDNYEIGQVYLTAFDKDTDSVSRFLSSLENKGITPHRLTQDQTLSFGEATLTLSPPKAASYSKKEDNNASLVVLAQLGEERLLFCGDAMEARIDELVKEDIGNIRFLKIPYHGKEISNLAALLDKTTPAICAVTCSNKNPPDESTLSLLNERNVKTYLTEDGPVHVSVSTTSLSVS